MCVAKQREELNIGLKGKYIIKQVKNCVYPGERRWRFDAEYRQERMHREK